MDERKVEKQTQEVDFELSDGSAVRGAVFLRLYEAHHSGHQRVGELLNEEPSFIPVRTDQGGFLLNTARIAVARIRADSEADELMMLGKQYPVRVRTVQGKEIEGVVCVNLPEEFSRVKDYFNQPVRFFAILQPGFVTYINRQSILSVLSIES
jgi:hypothetical protein